MNRYKIVFKIILFVFIIFSALSLFVFAFSFLKPNFETGFLRNKQLIFNGINKYAFYIHIFTAPFTLILSTILIFFRFENNPRLVHFHRLFGKIYILLVLVLSSPSGLIMSFYSIGGYISSISFILLSILWFYVTLKAFLFIKEKDIIQHKLYMQRSYIFVLSAILLRFYGAIAITFNLSTSEIRYIWISWLCWLPNILFFEFIQYKKKN